MTLNCGIMFAGVPMALMIRRLAILILVAAAASQTFAGVCFCGDSPQVPPCCKRKVEVNSYFSRKSCCEDQNCAFQRESSPTVAVSLAVNGGPAEQAATFPTGIPSIAPTISTRESFRPSVTARGFASRERPPDLYLRHHAFLI